MKAYIEIKVIDGDYKIMGLIYTRLHNTLAIMKCHDIGVSFPFATKKSTGTVLRLQAEDKKNLCELFKNGFIDLIERYADVSEIKKVPQNASYSIIKRWRNKKSKASIRRLISRGGDKNVLLPLIKHTSAVPFLRLYSKSTQRWWTCNYTIKKVGNEYISGTFNSFGLSTGGMVAEF